MMRYETTAILTFLGILAFLALRRAYVSYLVDDTRDCLFASRDEMFLYAAENGLLDVVAYRNLRGLMNSLIRYTHRLTMTRWALLYLGSSLLGAGAPPSFIEWQRSMQKLPADQQARLQAFHQECMVYMVRHIICRSLILQTVVRFVAAFLWTDDKRTSRPIRVIAEHSSLGLLEADALATA